jgi:glycerol uptake facilitator-like aquaporin
MGRGFAYFVGWMIAVAVSGAHFNPATTLAVYIAEGKYLR